MSIRTQKIVRFIPFVNLFVVYIQWFRCYHRNVIPNRTKRFFGNALIATAAGVVLLIVADLILKILESIFDIALLEIIMSLIVDYAIMFIFSSVLIYDQEKIYKESAK